MRPSRALRLAVVGLWAAGSTAAGFAWHQTIPPPAAPAAGQTPPVTEATGAISGVVIDGSTGRPVAGAIVTLGSPARGAMAGPTRQVTDGQGRFLFPRLAAGENFTLSAAKPGYLVGRFGQDEPRPGVGRRIALADGQWFGDARLTLWRTSAISGTVLDEAAEPVVGTFVRVLVQVMVAGRPQLAAGLLARTDDRGRYRIAGLSKGRYIVTVPSVQAAVPAETTPLDIAGTTPENVAAAEAAGRPIVLPDHPAVVVDPINRLILGPYVIPPPPVEGRSQTYPVTFYPASRTVADAATIDLGFSEERQSIDIRLTPSPAVRVSGVVQGPPDVSAKGLVVRLLPAGSESLGFGSETATALVGPSGAFTLLNVPAGAYTVAVSRSMMEYISAGSGMASAMYAIPSPPGFGGRGSGAGVVTSGSAGTNYSFKTSTGSAAYSARMTLAVGDRDLAGVVVPLRRAVTISGRFEWESGAPETATQMQARMGTPVYAEPANGDPTLGMPTGDTTRNDPTRFSVEGLQPGEYTLRVISFGGAVKSVAWEGRDYTHRSFDASQGRDFENVVVTLTTRVARLSGVVRDASGALAERAGVIVFPVERQLWAGYGFRPARIMSATVTNRSTYALAALPAGEYFAIAVDEALTDAWQDPRFLEAASAQATRVTLDWGDAKALDLTVKPVRR